MEALNVKLDDWLVDNTLDKIIIGSARIHVIIEQCELALCEAKDERFFQHGSDLVRVTLGDQQNAQHQPHEQRQTDQQEQDIRRPPDVPFLLPATSSSLHLALSRTQRVFRRDKNGQITRSDPPKSWGSLIMDRLVTTPERTPWSRIRYVTNSPTLLPNGDVVEAAGYHKESGIWFHKRGVEFAPIPQNPTRMQAREAMRTFEEIFCKFDFVTSKPGQKWNETSGFSALMSTILSVFVRNLVPTVPMLAINAPVAGAGKTLLANTISTATTGSGPVLVPFDNTDEFDKLLPPLFRQGPRLVVIDNIETTLRSARLCAALTQEGPLTYRILGESRSVQVENSAVFIATGNNLGISGDLPRRTLEVRLDPNSEHPEYRQFDFDPLVRARQWFPQLVVNALTAIRAYFLTGCPTKDGGAMAAATFDFGSFTGWNRTVRGFLLWLEYADPLTTQEGIEDPMRGVDLQILAAWYDMWGSKEHTINDIGRNFGSELHTLLLGSRREWDPNVVAHILRKLRDKVIGDYKLVKTAAGSTHGTRYRVDYVGKEPAPSGSPGQQRKKPKYAGTKA